MKWEDQEINSASSAGSIREIIQASFRIRSLAESNTGRYLKVTQGLLDREARGEVRPLIHRLCLYERALSGIGPGGEPYVPLGVSHFWSSSRSMYAILQVDPENNWLEIMALHAPHPNNQK